MGFWHSNKKDKDEELVNELAYLRKSVENLPILFAWIKAKPGGNVIIQQYENARRK